jgi:hypothetical protein
MEGIQRSRESRCAGVASRYFNRGDRVRVFDGPLTGLEGIFVRDKPNKGRLVVSINSPSDERGSRSRLRAGCALRMRTRIGMRFVLMGAVAAAQLALPRWRDRNRA